MSNGSSLSLPELEERIAIIRANIRQLVEQAAAFSGAEDEARNSDRIAQQTEELESLIKQRDALLKRQHIQHEPAFAQTCGGPRVHGPLVVGAPGLEPGTR